MTQFIIILQYFCNIIWCLTHFDIEWSTPFLGISTIITLGIFKIIDKIENTK
jgi:hypothetical protein